MFGPTMGFSGMVDSMEPCKMLWADPCCHGLGAEIPSLPACLMITLLQMYCGVCVSENIS